MPLLQLQQQRRMERRENNQLAAWLDLWTYWSAATPFNAPTKKLVYGVKKLLRAVNGTLQFE
jgi:hypothetical protein